MSARPWTGMLPGGRSCASSAYRVAIRAASPRAKASMNWRLLASTAPRTSAASSCIWGAQPTRPRTASAAMENESRSPRRERNRSCIILFPPRFRVQVSRGRCGAGDYPTTDWGGMDGAGWPGGRLQGEPVGRLDGDDVLGVDVEQGAPVARELEVPDRRGGFAPLLPHEEEGRAGAVFPPQYRVPAERSEVEVGVVEAERRRGAARIGIDDDGAGGVRPHRSLLLAVDVELELARRAELLEARVVPAHDQRLHVELEAQLGRERPLDARVERDLRLMERREDVARAVGLDRGRIVFRRHVLRVVEKLPDARLEEEPERRGRARRERSVERTQVPARVVPDERAVQPEGRGPPPVGVDGCFERASRRHARERSPAGQPVVDAPRIP